MPHAEIVRYLGVVETEILAGNPTSTKSHRVRMITWPHPSCEYYFVCLIKYIHYRAQIRFIHPAILNIEGFKSMNLKW